MTSPSPEPEASPTDSSTTKAAVQPFANSNLSSTAGALQKGRLILEQSYLFFTQLAKILGGFWREYKQLIINLLLIGSAVVTLKVVLAIISALNDIPLLAPTFQLVGIGYSIWFTGRYLLNPSTRHELLLLTQTVLNQQIKEIAPVRKQESSEEQEQSKQPSVTAPASVQSQRANVANEGEEKEVLVTSGQQSDPREKFETPDLLVDEAIPSNREKLSNEQIAPVNTTNQNEQVLYKPGEIVPTSGQYEVIGSDGASQQREITSTKGEHFPPSPESGMHYKLVDKTVHGANQNQADESVVKADEIEQLFKPGSIVPTSGQYAVINVDGTSIGREITSTKGEHFPPSPEDRMHYKLVDATRHKE
jgi:hypothetical protein